MRWTGRIVVLLIFALSLDASRKQYLFKLWALLSSGASKSNFQSLGGMERECQPISYDAMISI